MGEKILEKFGAFESQKAFGMELDAFQGIFAMANSHQHPITKTMGRGDKTGREGLFSDDERMISRRCKGVWETLIDSLSIMEDLARLAMHQGLGPYDLPSEGLSDRLMPETDSENRNPPCKRLDRCDRDSGLIRRTGARGDHDMGGMHRFDLRNRNRVIPKDPDFCPEGAERLHEVIGERIVIIDDENHASDHADFLEDRQALILFMPKRSVSHESREKRRSSF